MLVDWHVHTSDFSDGEMTLAEVVEAAREKGVRVGIADHWIHGMNTPQELERYLDALDHYPVYKGLEVSLGYRFEVPEELLGRLDYIIGSLHDLDWRGARRTFGLDRYYHYLLGENPEYVGPDPIWDMGAMDVVLEGFLQAIEDQPISILGHSTLFPPLFLKDQDKTLPDSWSEKLIDAAVAKGIAFEISDAWKLPHRRFLKMALEKGARFSFGSDAHRLCHVGELDYPVRMARELEIPEDRIFQLSDPK